MKENMNKKYVKIFSAKKIAPMLIYLKFFINHLLRFSSNKVSICGVFSVA